MTIEERARKFIDLLSGGECPASARGVAFVLGLTGNTEAQRRRIREAVELCRRRGLRVCANADGYWLARSNAEWADYKEARKSGARFEFVRIRKMAEAATAATGRQGLLFEKPRPWAFNQVAGA